MDLKLKTNWSYYTDVTFLYNSSSAVLLLKVSFCGQHFQALLFWIFEGWIPKRQKINSALIQHLVFLK